MSKTDKTTPWRVVESRGDCNGGVCNAGYPCRHFSGTSALRYYRFKHGRGERARVREALGRGVEPEPYRRHRHSAHYDAW